MTGLDGAIVLAFAAYAIASGLRWRRTASTGLEEYFLAGRSLSGTRAGLSMAATQFAADTPLLVTGLVATAGVFALWRLWIYALAFLLLGFVLAPAWRRAAVLTDAELAETRYAGRSAAALRALKALYFGTAFNCTVLAMVLFASVVVAEPFLLWDHWLPDWLFAPVVSAVRAVGVPLVSPAGGLGATDPELWPVSARNLLSIAALVSVTALYSATGGLRSVVRTDLAQLAVMLGATAGYAIWAVAEVGGLGALHAQLAAAYAGGGPGGLTLEQLLAFTPSQARDATGAVLAVLALQWLVQINADGTGYLAQRTMACRTAADARWAAWVFSAVQVLLRSLLWLPIVLCLLVLFPPAPELTGEALRAEREASFVRGMEALPVGLRGLMLTAMLAALASTLDSHLNWGASYWTHDLYDRFWCRAWRGRVPGERERVRVARLSTLGILVLSLALMTRLSSIQTAWHASLLLGAGVGVMLVLRWLWWRITARGELAALAASAGLAPLLLATVDSEGARLLFMACGATAAGIGVSLWLGPEPRDRLAAFHARARPPGFWGPFDGGLGRVRLTLGLLATFASATALFAALVGIGSWLAGGRPPDPFESRAAFASACGALSAVSGALGAWWGFVRLPSVESDTGEQRDSSL